MSVFFFSSERERGRQSILPLSLWYSQWSTLTPPANWVMVGGGDGDEEEVVGFLIPPRRGKGMRKDPFRLKVNKT